MCWGGGAENSHMAVTLLYFIGFSNVYSTFNKIRFVWPYFHYVGHFLITSRGLWPKYGHVDNNLKIHCGGVILL